MGEHEQDETQRGRRDVEHGRGGPNDDAGEHEQQTVQGEPADGRGTRPGVQELLHEETNDTLDAPFRDRD